MLAIERWIAVIDKKTCKRCRQMHGRKLRTDEGPRPPLHWACRCRRVFVKFVDVPPPGEDEDEEEERGGKGAGGT